jgi:hypothetical protein
MRGLLGAVIGVLLFCLNADAGTPWPLGSHHGKSYTVRYSPGGDIDTFLVAADKIKHEGAVLRIDGPCISACTMAADRLRPNNVCVTPRALFGFHNVTVTLPNGGQFRSPAGGYYHWDISRWVHQRGGFPGTLVGDETLLIMTFKESAAFFPVCS